MMRQVSETKSCWKNIFVCARATVVFARTRASIFLPSIYLKKELLLALLFWFFGGFRCGVPLFIVMLVIY